MRACRQGAVAVCDASLLTSTTTTTTSTTLTSTEPSPSTTSTTMPAGNRTEVFPFTDAYGNVATLTVEVDTEVPVIRFTEAVEAGDFLRSQVGEFRQVVGVNDRTWAVGTLGNVIHIVGTDCHCSYPIHCVPGDVWCQSYGPPWPVGPEGAFDPAQPFVILWQGTALYVE